MERNVFSFLVAIRKGFEPKLYTYEANKIPVGKVEVMLDFKTWSKRIIAINCYCTRISTGEKFIVTVYCNNKTGKYEVPGSSVDFLTCPIAASYLLTLERNEQQRIIMTAAKGC